MSASVITERPETLDDDRPSGIKLPKVNESKPPLAEGSPTDDTRNPLFDLLVQNETDLVGLLAYSLYKQNKRDWLITFQAKNGREPGEAETSAFILGERLPRRIATYRTLAEDMLKQGKEHSVGLPDALVAMPANDLGGPKPSLHQAARSPTTWRNIGFMLALLVVMAIVFRFAASWLFGPR